MKFKFITIFIVFLILSINNVKAESYTDYYLLDVNLLGRFTGYATGRAGGILYMNEDLKLGFSTFLAGFYYLPQNITLIKPNGTTEETSAGIRTVLPVYFYYALQKQENITNKYIKGHSPLYLYLGTSLIDLDSANGKAFDIGIGLQKYKYLAIELGIMNISKNAYTENKESASDFGYQHPSFNFTSVYINLKFNLLIDRKIN